MRLREAENEERVRKQKERIEELEEEDRRSREDVPEPAIAGLQVHIKLSYLSEDRSPVFYLLDIFSCLFSFNMSILLSHIC